MCVYFALKGINSGSEKVSRSRSSCEVNYWSGELSAFCGLGNSRLCHAVYSNISGERISLIPCYRMSVIEHDSTVTLDIPCAQTGIAIPKLDLCNEFISRGICRNSKLTVRSCATE